MRTKSSPAFFGFSLKARHHAVTQHHWRDVFDILRHHISAAIEERVRAGGARKCEGCARRCTEGHQPVKRHFRRLRVTRSHHDVDDVILDAVVHGNFVDHCARGGDVLGLHHGRDLGWRGCARHAIKNQPLLARRRIAHHELEHESVDLRLGQRIGSFLLDRILRCQYEERFRQRIGFAADGDLSLLHGFEQRRLHLRRRAIDLVGKNDVGEDRPLLHHEIAATWAVDHRAHQVGGQQVGRKLNALKGGVQSAGQTRNRGGLGQSRNAFDQNVSVGEKPKQQSVHKVVLADDDPMDLVLQQTERAALLGYFALDGGDVS